MNRQIPPKKNGGSRFPARKSRPCLFLLGAGVLLLGLIFTHAHVRRHSDISSIHRLATVVEKLELTDLALFTEARYTRHPSQADLYSAFQDHPTSLEHFPMGSIAAPSAALRRLHGKVD